MAQHTNVTELEKEGKFYDTKLQNIFSYLREFIFLTEFSDFFRKNKIDGKYPLIRLLPDSEYIIKEDGEFEGWQAWKVENTSIPKDIRDEYGNIEVHVNLQTKDHHFYLVM